MGNYTFGTAVDWVVIKAVDLHCIIICIAIHLQLM